MYILCLNTEREREKERGRERERGGSLFETKRPLENKYKLITSQ